MPNGIDDGLTPGMNRPKLDRFGVGSFQNLIAVHANSLLDGRRDLARKNHVESTVPNAPLHELGRVGKVHGAAHVLASAMNV